MTNQEKLLEEELPTGIPNELKVSSTNDVQLPTDMSDTTESDVEKNNKYGSFIVFVIKDFFPKKKHCYSPVCTELHEGKILMNETIPLHVDSLFTLLFTSSKFFLDFHASRKTTDLTQTAWSHNGGDGTKIRIVNLTVPLTQTMGPKTSQVTETQVSATTFWKSLLYWV